MEGIIDENKIEVKYANFWIRLGAALLDALIFLPVFAFNFYNIFEIRSIELFILLVSIQAYYKPFMEYKFGGTLGKMICKIRVVDENYQPITGNQAMLRWIQYFPNYIFSIMMNFRIFEALGDIQFNDLLEYSQWQIDNVQPSFLESNAPILIVIFAVFVALDNNTKRGLHDRIAKTFVIHTSTPKQ